MDSIWVELAASGSTAHGPSLRIRLVSDQHPAVQAASQAVQAASEADCAERAQRAERAVKLPLAQATTPQQVGHMVTYRQTLRCHGANVPQICKNHVYLY